MCEASKKRIDQSDQSAVNALASPRGFEPPAYRLGGGCSIQLSYEDFFRNAFYHTNKDKSNPILWWRDRPRRAIIQKDNKALA